MEEVPPQENLQQAVAPRRSLRRSALSEIHETSINQETPSVKNASPDELVIIQRGRRRKPITWSPVEYDKTKILGPPRDITPERSPPAPIRPEINSRLRRRLVLSPEKIQNSTLGEAIARKLRALPKDQESLNLRK